MGVVLGGWGVGVVLLVLLWVWVCVCVCFSCVLGVLFAVRLCCVFECGVYKAVPYVASGHTLLRKAVPS